MSGYEPRGGARELLTCTDPAVVISGAAGTGKSLAAGWRVVLRCIRTPGVQAIVVRQTHASLTASTLRTLETGPLADLIASGHVKWFGGSGNRPPAYEFWNQSRIMVGGLDNPGKLLGQEPDIVFVDEATQISATAFEILSSRLRGTADCPKSIVLATNPDSPQHWIRKYVEAGRIRLITSLHSDNPRFVDRDGNETAEGAVYLAKLRAMTGVRRARYYEGRWVAAEGQIFDGWSDATHWIEPFDVPSGWRWIESVDFGFQHPMTWGRFAVDPDGRMYLVAEMSRRHRLVEDFAKDILEVRRNRGWGRPEVVVTDHAAGDRATLEKHLVEATFKADKRVVAGIQALQGRLDVAGDGRARFFVMRDSLVRNDPLAASDGLPRGFAAEVGGYVWAPVRGSDDRLKEEPVKLNDDAMDMARYAVMYLDGQSPPKLGNPAAQRQNAPATSSVWGRPVGR